MLMLMPVAAGCMVQASDGGAGRSAQQHRLGCQHEEHVATLPGLTQPKPYQTYMILLHIPLLTLECLLEKGVAVVPTYLTGFTHLF
jgi:hypothetical protein